MKFELSKLDALNPCEIAELENGFQLAANPNSDFINKFEEYVKDTASFYFVKQEGNFTIKAKVRTEGVNDFDAAFLMVRQDQSSWVKLAVELSVDKQYNVVSVITNEWSDDANGELLSSNECWLRITRKKDFFGLHYSENGEKWRFVRAFGLKMSPSVAVGFGIQAPKGDVCKGSITELSITNTIVDNFRNGS